VKMALIFYFLFMQLIATGIAGIVHLFTGKPFEICMFVASMANVILFIAGIHQAIAEGLASYANRRESNRIAARYRKPKREDPPDTSEIDGKNARLALEINECREIGRTLVSIGKTIEGKFRASDYQNARNTVMERMREILTLYTQFKRKFASAEITLKEADLEMMRECCKICFKSNLNAIKHRNKFYCLILDKIEEEKQRGRPPGSNVVFSVGEDGNIHVTYE